MMKIVMLTLENIQGVEGKEFSSIDFFRESANYLYEMYHYQS